LDHGLGRVEERVTPRNRAVWGRACRLSKRIKDDCIRPLHHEWKCRPGSTTRQASILPGNLIIGDEPRITPTMKKHNRSSGDRPLQYDGKYSRHSSGQAKAKEHATYLDGLSGAATTLKLDLQ